MRTLFLLGATVSCCNASEALLAKEWSFLKESSYDAARFAAMIPLVGNRFVEKTLIQQSGTLEKAVPFREGWKVGVGAFPSAFGATFVQRMVEENTKHAARMRGAQDGFALTAFGSISGAIASAPLYAMLAEQGKGKNISFSHAAMLFAKDPLPAFKYVPAREAACLLAIQGCKSPAGKNEPWTPYWNAVKYGTIASVVSQPFDTRIVNPKASRGQLFRGTGRRVLIVDAILLGMQGIDDLRKAIAR